MIPFVVWLRRCSAARLFPGLVVAVFVVLHARAGWARDWGWAFDWAAVTSHLLGVLLAGLVAHDVGVRAAPTLILLAGTAPRGRRGLCLIGGATWLVGMGAWLTGVGYMTVRLLVNGAGAPPASWWFVLETGSSLLAATMVGLAVGLLLPGRAAGPLAALGVFLVSILVAVFFGLDFLFRPGGNATDLIGWERTPAVAASFCALHLALAGCAVVLAFGRATRAPRRRALLRTAAVAVAVAAVIGHGSVARDHEPFRLAGDVRTCATSNMVTVCGPEPGAHVLLLLARDIDGALSGVAGSGIDWATHYVWLPGPLLQTTPAGYGVVDADPSDIGRGSLSPESVASTLAFPRMCPALQGSAPPMGLLHDQGVVRAWVEGRLGGSIAAPRAPEQVRSAYRSACACGRGSP